LIDYTITLRVKPFKLVKNISAAAAMFFIIASPNHISQASDQIAAPVNFATIERNNSISRVLSELEPKLVKATPVEIRRVSEVIVDECKKTGVDPLFVLAIIESESNYDLEAVSPTGARGLMQIIPSTFRAMSDSKRMFDPVENVRAGIRYIRHLRDIGFGKRGGPESILLAYNQGPGTAMIVYKDGFPIPDEAASYIPNVMSNYRKLLVKHGYHPKDARKLFITV
jgi:soluble lytic murein transglycosylase-like protein